MPEDRNKPLANEIVRLIALPEDDLLLELAAELRPYGLEVGPTQRDSNRRFASRWLEQWLQANRDAICTHPAVVAVLHDAEAQSDVDDATILLDIVLPFLGGPPLATVAVLVARRGLRRLCD